MAFKPDRTPGYKRRYARDDTHATVLPAGRRGTRYFATGDLKGCAALQDA